MIPQGREVRTEAEVAQECATPLRTWQRRDREGFEARVPRINPGERVRLYDAAQADAYVKGMPVPPGPDPAAEHPEDLLTDKEAAAVLGQDYSPSTVRSYAARGYLTSLEYHGRRYRRADVEARRDSPDMREHPEVTGAGRPSGDPNNRGRAGNAPRGADPRAVETAAELAAAEQGTRPQVTAAELADRYEVSTRTAERILQAARQQRL